jgi:hypothetical protein
VLGTWPNEFRLTVVGTSLGSEDPTMLAPTQFLVILPKYEAVA